MFFGGPRKRKSIRTRQLCSQRNMNGYRSVFKHIAENGYAGYDVSSTSRYSPAALWLTISDLQRERSQSESLIILDLLFRWSLLAFREERKLSMHTNKMRVGFT